MWLAAPSDRIGHLCASCESVLFHNVSRSYNCSKTKGFLHHRGTTYYPPIYRYENHSWEQLPAEEKAEAELERHRTSAHKGVDIHRSMSIIPGYCDQKKIVLPVSIPEIDPTLTQSSQHFENVFRKYFLNKKDWGKPETFKKHCFGSVRF